MIDLIVFTGGVLFLSLLFSWPLSLVFWIIVYPFHYIHKKRMEGKKFVRTFDDVMKDYFQITAFISGSFIFISLMIIYFNG